MQARGDVPNDIATNGERYVQDQVLEIYRQANPITVLDIGANVGAWAKPLLDEAYRRSITHIEIHAFEPVPETFEVLSNHLKEHPLRDRIHFVERAMSGSAGVDTMTIYRELGETNSLHDGDSSTYSKKILINKITVDTYCALHNIGAIHLMKVDAEGHDCEVLFGARACFDEERIMICQFEYNYRWVFSRHYLKDVFDFVVDRPYKVAKLVSTHVELYNLWHPEVERFFESNWLILHESTLPLLPVSYGSFDRFNTFSEVPRHGM